MMVRTDRRTLVNAAEGDVIHADFADLGAVTCRFR
jgi:2-keto-4-pentenoate hydratase